MSNEIKRTPRPHQQEAIQKVVKGLRVSDRGQLLMACGTGKTLTALWIKEALNAGRTLVLLPSLSLLSQTLKVWSDQCDGALNWICVCSDQSVAKKDKDADEWVVNLSDLGIPVTSNAESIKKFLMDSPDGVVFSTYQSSPLVVRAQGDSGVPSFDLAIADEAHRCAGRVSDSFGCILDSQSIRASKRLFMTATPRVLSSRIKSRADEEELVSACMDDTSVFGEVLHRLNFSEAIKKNLLCDYKVIVVGVDDPMIQSQIQKNSVISTPTGSEINSETIAHHIALSKAMKDHGLNKVITFHSRVRTASDFAKHHEIVVDALPDDSKSLKQIQIGHVCGDMDSSERNQKIDLLRTNCDKSMSILTNARCLSEGVDVPTLDGVAFIDPRRSVVDIVQAVGRAIRKATEKGFGYVILPVYLGDTVCSSQDIDESKFGDIWKVLLALKSQDDTLSNCLNQIRIDQGSKHSKTNASSMIASKIAIDLPENVVGGFSDSLHTVLVEKLTDVWHERYGELVLFVEENGHCRVPFDHPRLGYWVVKQRQEYRKGRLSLERIEYLNRIGFYWDLVQSLWLDSFEKLKQYKETTGHTNAPWSHETLGRWVSKQRVEYNNGSLSIDRQKLLNGIGFDWNPEDSQWMENYQKLVEFVKENDTAFVPTKNHEIGYWVGTQRDQYKKGKLSNERIDLLNQTGFIWNTHDWQWNEKYEALKEYSKVHGDCNVPKGNKELGGWVNLQRNAYKEGNLTESRKQLLTSIGFVWRRQEFEWNQKMLLLSEYVKDNGVIPPYGDPLIGTWFSSQKSQYIKGKMPVDRVPLFQQVVNPYLK